MTTEAVGVVVLVVGCGALGGIEGRVDDRIVVYDLFALAITTTLLS